MSLVLKPSIRFALVALGDFAMAAGPYATLLSFGINSPNRSCLFLRAHFSHFITHRSSGPVRNPGDQTQPNNTSCNITSWFIFVTQSVCM